MAQRGGARPGAGRKKGAVAQATRDIQSMSREHADKALKTLADIATGGESEGARVSAATAILDRAYGRPKQSVDVDLEAKVEVMDARERLARLVAGVSAAGSACEGA